MSDIRVGDWLSSVNYKPDFLGQRIQEFQRFKGFPERACLYTHSEVVWWVSPDGQQVCTFSQTFPRAMPVYYSTWTLESKLRADKPTRDLHRIVDYGRIVTPKFVSALDRKAREICQRRPTGKAAFLAWIGVNYDFLQLPGYWLNELIGRGKHRNWLEIPGGVGTCSDKAAEVEDAGFFAELGYSPIFLTKPNSEITPAHIATEPMFERVIP